jgi:NADP-dependent 3-hydroxy acid dehydrogenase YdfG
MIRGFIVHYFKGGGIVGKKQVKTAWITGGGSGIGLAGARAIGALGYRVIISGRSEDRLKGAVKKLTGEGTAADYVVMDVADPAQVDAASGEIKKKYGDLSILVCSAGTNIKQRHWADLDIGGFRRVVDTNFTGVAQLVNLALPGMRKAKDGLIIVVASWAGWRYGTLTGPAYSGTKLALSYLVESINDEEGRNGIRACNLCPGEVNTEILKTRPVMPPAADLKRMLQAGDLGRLIGFLAATPPSVCFNEVVISPTWNRTYIGRPEAAEEAAAGAKAVAGKAAAAKTAGRPRKGAR